MRSAFHRHTILFLLSIVSPAVAVAQQHYVPAEELWRFDPPVSEQMTGGKWFGAAGETSWLLHPDGSILRRRTHTQERKDGAQAVRTSRQERLPLPPGVTPQAMPGLNLSLIAVSDEVAWLIDGTQWRVWRVGDTHWRGPWRLGEEPGDATVTADGALVINTPGDPRHAFAVLDADGNVTVRFGERLAPPRRGLDSDWNRWELATLTDGKLIAAHDRSERLRLYDGAFHLVREWNSEAPAAAKLRQAAGPAEEAIRVDPATCCWAARLVLFASRVIPLDANRFALRYGEVPVLQEFDERGRWVEATPIALQDFVKERLIGIAAFGRELVVVTSRRTVRMDKSAGGRAIEGTIVSKSGGPIAGATLTFSAASGAQFTATAGEAGRFTTIVSRPSETYAVTIAAVGYRPAHYRGPLSRLGRRIVLLPPLRQCVHVFDAATRDPIVEFDVALRHDDRTAGGLLRSITTSPSKASDGITCIDVPFDPPWTLTVSAEGYAAASIVVDQIPAARTDIGLRSGATIDVAVRSKSGPPVAGAEVELTRLPAEATDVETPKQTATTDPAGNVHFEGLTPGEHHLSAISDHFVPLTKTVSIADGTNTEEVDLDPGATLHIHVLAASGNIEGAVATLELLSALTPRSLECTTDPDGNCAIDALANGRYEARARSEGMSTGFRPVEIKSGDMSIEIRLTESLRLTGTIANPSDYPDLQLEVVVSKPGVPFLTGPVDSQGQFAIEEVPSGVLNLRVQERQSISTLLYRQITIPGGQRTHDIALRLPEPIALYGSLRFQRAGCGDCSLTVRRAGAEVDLPAIRATVDPSGGYRASVPGRGVYVAHAEAPDGSFDRKVLDVGGPMSRDFELGDSRVTISVQNENGTPEARARVYAIDESRGIAVADILTDDSGTAGLPFPAGSVTVTATKGAGIGSAHVSDADAGRSVAIVLRTRSGLRIDLRNAGGAPIGRAVVRLRSSRSAVDTGPQVLARSSDEPFEIAAPADESHDLIIKAPGYAYKTMYGVPGDSVQTVTLMGGLTLAVRVAGTLAPCAIQLVDNMGRTYGLSTDFPLGPVPLTAREAIFNPIEPGNYTLTLYTCGGSAISKPIAVSPGGTTPMVSFE